MLVLAILIIYCYYYCLCYHFSQIYHKSKKKILFQFFPLITLNAQKKESKGERKKHKRKCIAFILTSMMFNLIS